MEKDFKTELAKMFHIHFGYVVYDSNEKKIKPDEIAEWFIKALQQKSVVFDKK